MVIHHDFQHPTKRNVLVGATLPVVPAKNWRTHAWADGRTFPAKSACVSRGQSYEM